MPATPNLRVSQAAVTYAYNIKTPNVRVQQAVVLQGQRRVAKIQVPQASVFVALKGRIDNPSLKAWTFDLDGHEFYVLRLGDEKTLVYDLTTQQWSQFASGDLPYWRANYGINWQNSGANPRIFGSNVVHGDDTHGIIWFLSPYQSYDTSIYKDEIQAKVRYNFTREASAQLPVRGRDFVKCFEVYANTIASLEALAVNSVILRYSDDGGKTFRQADEVKPGVGKELAWRSLGNMSPPGRIFTVRDDGSISKLESLSISNA